MVPPFVLGGAEVCERRVPLTRAVEGLDEVEDGHPDVVAGAPARVVDQFTFEGGEEGLGEGIVIAIADRAHRDGDLDLLQLEGGWEDLSVPQRFYVDVEVARAGRPSVMDRWDLERRKRERGQPAAPAGARSPVQAVQVRELRKTSRSWGR